MIITRSVTNNTPYTLTLKVPTLEENLPPITISPSATLDLLSVVTEDNLIAMQLYLSGMVSRGNLTVAATIDTSSFEYTPALPPQIGFPNQNGGVTPGANVSLVCPLYIPATVIVTHWLVNTPSAPGTHYDVGVYDLTGAKIYTSGSTDAGSQIVPVSPNLVLASGSYIMAISQDNAGISYSGSDNPANGLMSYSSTFPLPSSFNLAAGTPNGGGFPCIIGIIQGGIAIGAQWS